MLKCVECGHVFSEYELNTWEESRGEHFGIPCYEKMSGCPICEGDYEDAVECDVCGENHLASELTGGVCEDCIKKYQHDVDMHFKIGANDTDSIDLNCFLASVFTKEDIELILLNALKLRKEYAKKQVESDCERFIEYDREWFAERLAEEVKKNEDSKN